MTITVKFDLGPNLITLGSKLVGYFDDLKASLDDLKTTASAEHDEVMAAFAALEAKLGDVLTADQKAAITSEVADVKAAIGGIFVPPTP